MRSAWALLLGLALVVGCADEDGDDGDSSIADGGDGGDGGPPATESLPYRESFDQVGGVWPAPWRTLNEDIIEHAVEDGRARFTSRASRVARMGLPGYGAVDVDVVVTVTFEDFTSQGFGFYARQNGGSLTDTDPPGQGYSMFPEGFIDYGIGVWRERDGSEEILAHGNVDFEVANGEPYKCRLQVEQMGDGTAVRAKMWPAEAEEPQAWNVEHVDDTPSLQNRGGSFAVDNYSLNEGAAIYVDDIEITEL